MVSMFRFDVLDADEDVNSTNGVCGTETTKTAALKLWKIM